MSQLGEEGSRVATLTWACYELPDTHPSCGASRGSSHWALYKKSELNEFQGTATPSKNRRAKEDSRLY